MLGGHEPGPPTRSDSIPGNRTGVGLLAGGPAVHCGAVGRLEPERLSSPMLSPLTAQPGGGRHYAALTTTRKIKTPTSPTESRIGSVIFDGGELTRTGASSGRPAGAPVLIRPNQGRSGATNGERCRDRPARPDCSIFAKCPDLPGGSHCPHQRSAEAPGVAFVTGAIIAVLSAVTVGFFCAVRVEATARWPSRRGDS